MRGHRILACRFWGGFLAAFAMSRKLGIALMTSISHSLVLMSGGPQTFPVEINDFNEGKCVRGGASRMKAAGENREQGCCQATKVLNHKTPMSWAASQTSKILDQPVCLCFFHSISDFHDCRTAVRQPVEKGLRSGEIRGLEGLLEQGGAIRADDR